MTTKKPKRVETVKAWLVTNEWTDLSKRSAAGYLGASIFWKYAEAFECVQTCGDGYSVRRVEVRIPQ